MSWLFVKSASKPSDLKPNLLECISGICCILLEEIGDKFHQITQPLLASILDFYPTWDEALDILNQDSLLFLASTTLLICSVTQNFHAVMSTAIYGTVCGGFL